MPDLLIGLLWVRVDSSKDVWLKLTEIGTGGQTSRLSCPVKENHMMPSQIKALQSLQLIKLDLSSEVRTIVRPWERGAE